MNSLILTAGQGRRFEPYTKLLAKPAIEFLTLPMLMYSRYYAEALSSKSIIYNLHHLPQTIKAANDQFKNNDLKFYYSDESQKLLDSGGGITKALSTFCPTDSSVFVSNGDNICIIAPDELQKAQLWHQNNKHDITLIVGSHSDAGTKLSALYADPDFNLKDKGLNRSDQFIAYHYLGMMFFNAEISEKLPTQAFSLFDEGLLPNLQKFNIKLYVVDSYLWYETGNPKDYLKATQSCLGHLKNKDTHGQVLQSILNKYRPELSYELSSTGLNLSGSKLVNSKVSGFTVIGFECDIYNSQLKNSVMQSGAKLSGKSTEDTIIIQ